MDQKIINKYSKYVKNNFNLSLMNCLPNIYWIPKTKRKDLLMAQKFGNALRFLDDLTAINDLEFENFTLRLYDKGDLFPVSIVRMPHLPSFEILRIGS